MESQGSTRLKDQFFKKNQLLVYVHLPVTTEVELYCCGFNSNILNFNISIPFVSEGKVNII